MIHGQIPPTPGLDTFSRHRGFEVLDQGAGLDLWVIFGVPSHVYPDPGERIFVRRQRP